MLCPALRLSLNVMIFKTTDHAGLRNCLRMLKRSGAAGVELQDKQRTQQMTQWEFPPGEG